MKQKEFSEFVIRRSDLAKFASEVLGRSSDASLIAFSGFENGAYDFRADNSFYYLTGLNEPGMVLLLDLDGSSTIFAPTYKVDRAAWTEAEFNIFDEGAASVIGVDSVVKLGDPKEGYAFAPPLVDSDLSGMSEIIGKKVASKDFKLLMSQPQSNLEAVYFVGRLCDSVDELSGCTVDASELVHAMRRVKSDFEIEAILRSANVTGEAHRAAEAAIRNGGFEADVMAAIASVYAKNDAYPAYSPVVAAGKNSCVLHHVSGRGEIKDGEVVLVDTGASLDFYASDVTRVYPVSGKFSSDQQKIYDIVLEAHAAAADSLKPGMWIRSDENQESSLYHIALKSLKKHGYGEAFIHNIGHSIGMHVHDVGDNKEPLREGNVITIEPGVYLPDVGFGIRIEDDYLVTSEGAECLTCHITK